MNDIIHGAVAPSGDVEPKRSLPGQTAEHLNCTLCACETVLFCSVKPDYVHLRQIVHHYVHDHHNKVSLVWLPYPTVCDGHQVLSTNRHTKDLCFVYLTSTSCFTSQKSCHRHTRSGERGCHNTLNMHFILSTGIMCYYSNVNVLKLFAVCKVLLMLASAFGFALVLSHTIIMTYVLFRCLF